MAELYSNYRRLLALAGGRGRGPCRGLFLARAAGRCAALGGAGSCDKSLLPKRCPDTCQMHTSHCWAPALDPTPNLCMRPPASRLCLCRAIPAVWRGGLQGRLEARVPGHASWCGTALCGCREAWWHQGELFDGIGSQAVLPTAVCRPCFPHLPHTAEGTKQYTPSLFSSPPAEVTAAQAELHGDSEADEPSVAWPDDDDDNEGAASGELSGGGEAGSGSGSGEEGEEEVEGEGEQQEEEEKEEEGLQQQRQQPAAAATAGAASGRGDAGSSGGRRGPQPGAVVAAQQAQQRTPPSQQAPRRTAQQHTPASQQRLRQIDIRHFFRRRQLAPE